VQFQGRFTIAAKHHVSIAEIYETETLDVQKVMSIPSPSAPTLPTSTYFGLNAFTTHRSTRSRILYTAWLHNHLFLSRCSTSLSMMPSHCRQCYSPPLRCQVTGFWVYRLASFPPPIPSKEGYIAISKTNCILALLCIA